MPVDNATDVFRLWLPPRGGDDANPADPLTVGGQTEFLFRCESAGDLRTYFIKTGGGSGLLGSFFLDDIDLEGSDEENLNNPTAYPSVVPVPAEVDARSILRLLPAPSRSGATILLDAPAGVVEGLWICGTCGRRIARLPAASGRSGGSRARWNGTDHAGRLVESGVYGAVRAGIRNRPAEAIVLLR